MTAAANYFLTFALRYKGPDRLIASLSGGEESPDSIGHPTS